MDDARIIPTAPDAPLERWAPLSWRRRLKNRLIARLVHQALELAVRLPGRAALGFGARLGRLAGLVAHGERHRTERHLCAALGLREGSPEARRLSLAVFEHLGRCAGELAWAWRSPERVRELVRFAPGALETMRRRSADGRGVLFITGHLGNWELLAWAVQLAGIPSAPIGRRSYDPGLTALIERWRGRWGALTLWRESPRIGDEIVAALEHGVSVGVLIDQAVDLPSVEVPFFGRPARTVLGPALLALGRRFPVVVGSIHRRPDGLHLVHVEDSPPPVADGRPPGAVARAWIASWSAALERAIRDEPAQWVWMHDRWRDAKGERG
jgi:KDO2-lipid IV(A) lauroyltransferase